MRASYAAIAGFAALAATSAAGCINTEDCRVDLDCPTNHECTNIGTCRLLPPRRLPIPGSTDSGPCVPDPNAGGSGEQCSTDLDCRNCRTCFSGTCVYGGTFRISLSWTVDSDFDLHVLTPLGNEIFYANDAADGGKLDIDDCVSTCRPTQTGIHVENIYFTGTAPAGMYETWAVNYDGRNGGDMGIEVSGLAAHTFTSSLSASPGLETMHWKFTIQ